MPYSHKKTRSIRREVMNEDTGQLTNERVNEIEKSNFSIDFQSPYGTFSYAAWDLMGILKFTATEYEMVGHFIRNSSRTTHGFVVTGTNVRLRAELGIDKATFYRAAKKVKASGLVYQVGGGAWQLNPRWMFNGGGEAHFWALKAVPASVPDLFHLTSYGKAKTVAALPWESREKHAA